MSEKECWNCRKYLIGHKCDFDEMEVCLGGRGELNYKNWKELTSDDAGKIHDRMSKK